MVRNSRIHVCDILLKVEYSTWAKPPKAYVPQHCLDVIECQKGIKQIIFSDFVIFELNAKVSKLLPTCRDLDIKTRLLIDLRNRPKFKICDSYQSGIWNLSCFLRKYHSDYVDCIHWATAFSEKVDVFVTEDQRIAQLSKDSEFLKEFTNEFALHDIEIKNFHQYTREMVKVRN